VDVTTILMALMLLVAGWWFAGVVRRATARVQERRSVPVVAIDLAPHHIHAIESLESGDPEPMVEVLFRDVATTERHYLLQRMAERMDADVVRAWVDRVPESPAARILAAAVELQAALDARGAGTADTVSEEGGSLFIRHAALAEDHARAVTESDPDDPIPWLILMRTAFALSGDLEEHTQRYRQAAARAPDSWAVHHTALLAASERWFGSFGVALELARAAGRGRPESPLSLMVIRAHLMRWEYLSYFEEDDEAADAYWDRRDVIEEVQRAFDAFIDQVPDGMDGALARSVAAGWFALRGDEERLVRAFGDDPVYFEREWQIFGGEKAYRQARLWAAEASAA